MDCSHTEASSQTDGTLTKLPRHENQATPRLPSHWPSVSSPPGNPLANCPERFSESSGPDRQALLPDESTYSTNVFLARFVRHKITDSENCFSNPRSATRSR